MDVVTEVRALVDELVGGKPDEVVQQRKNADGSTTAYVVRTSKSLLGRVHDLLEPGAAAPRDRPGKTPKKKPTAPIPVATDAFNVLVIAEAGIRELESLLRKALNLPATFGGDPRGTYRSPSFVHTAKAMHHVADLLDHLATANAEHPLVTGAPHDPEKPNARKPGRVLREVRAWHRAAMTIVGFRTEWARLRYAIVEDRETGKKTRKRVGCPYCKAQSLKQRPRDGAVVCCNPKCQTPSGERAEWSQDVLAGLRIALGVDRAPEPATDPAAPTPEGATA